MRISKRTREQAALICAIAAVSEIDNYVDVAEWIGLERWSKPLALAEAAWLHCHRVVGMSQRDAEAEALLRTGWSP